MHSKLIVAAAGSGKTTHLVNEALKMQDGKVLITTFTDENEREIRKKIIKLNGAIPPNIIVQTWFSFLLQHGVRPYQGAIYGDKRICGLKLVNSKSGYRGQYRGRPIYFGEKDIPQYYFNGDMMIYSDKIAKFACVVNKLTGGLIIDRISRIFKYILIDEVQDMAGYDLELIKLCLGSSIKVLMVGDPRQVTYHTHEEAKYKRYSEGKIEDFIIEQCKGYPVDIDHDSLNVNHRSHEKICALANRVFPEYGFCEFENQPLTGHDGVFLIEECTVDDYLADFRPMQLRDKVSVTVNKNYPATTFGAAKGLTFDRVLIYPTQPMLDWLSDHSITLAEKSRSRLYVALTRARYSVAIVVNSKRKISSSIDLPFFK